MAHDHSRVLGITEPNVHVLITGICTLLHNRNAGPTAVEIPLLLHERRSTGTNEPIPPHEAFLVTSADYDIIDRWRTDGRLRAERPTIHFDPFQRRPDCRGDRQRARYRGRGYAHGRSRS